MKPVVNPVVPQDKELGCVVNGSTVDVKENQMIANTTQVIVNDSIENSTVVQASGEQDNNTNSVNNSKGTIQNQRNGNSIWQLFVDLSHGNWQNATIVVNNYFK